MNVELTLWPDPLPTGSDGDAIVTYGGDAWSVCQRIDSLAWKPGKAFVVGSSQTQYPSQMPAAIEDMKRRARMIRDHCKIPVEIIDRANQEIPA